MKQTFPKLNSLERSLTEAQQNKSNQAKRNLRAIVRKQRQALSPEQQKLASKKLIANLKTSLILLRHDHIALYLGNDGEICPRELISELRKFKKQAYLPVIHPLNKQQLIFCRVTPKTLFKKNRFGIQEPVFKRSDRLAPKHLSLVLMPLVAFDDQGNRMGMGGGFYDRVFAYKHVKKNTRPRLIGLAHDFQKQVSLPLAPWDVPLEGIMTEKAFYSR